ncbi:MAG: hypothetical protein HZC52_00300 [Planctomycetes bacterium]|nr:hypothetical protein [Planctomycetota bacterium]
MKSINLNIKSLQPVIETFGKKVKQWKHYLPIINLALLIGIAGLAIICVLLVYHPPENITKPEKYIEETLLKKNPLTPMSVDNKSADYYELMLSNNPFSPNRTAWNPYQKSINRKSRYNKKQKTFYFYRRRRGDCRIQGKKY